MEIFVQTWLSLLADLGHDVIYSQSDCSCSSVSQASHSREEHTRPTLHCLVQNVLRQFDNTLYKLIGLPTFPQVY